MGRKMKDSGVEWIGEIPEEWRVKRLGSCFSECKVKNDDNVTSNALQFKMGKIIRKPIRWSQEENKETYSAYTIVYPGVVMINGLNLEFDFVTQRVGLVEENGIITSAYIALSPRDDVNARYMCYLLKSYDNCKAFHSMGRGLRKILNYNELKTKPIIIPSLYKQHRISDYLDEKCVEIDSVIEKAHTSIEEYKHLKQAVITQAVTKGVRGDRLMKDSGIEWIGSVPEKWKIVNLGRHMTIESGISVGKTYEPGTTLVEVPYLRVANVQGDHIDFSDIATILVTPDEAEKYKLHAGQLLMTEGGDRDKLGRGCMWNGEIDNCIHQNHVFAVQTDEELLTEYLDYLTTSDVARTYFDITAKKTTNLACTNKTTIQKFTIPVPPDDEQKEICEFLDDKCEKLNHLITQKEQLLTELENYKKSLIYEYVTGKKEVPNEC